MKDQFEWSESGMRLLETIQKVIDDNGGIEEMYKIIAREQFPNQYKREVLGHKQKLRILRGNIPMKDIPGILGISVVEMYRLIKELDQCQSMGD